MKQIQTYCLSTAIFIIIQIGFLFSKPAQANADEEWVAKIVSVQGDVQAKKRGEMQWVPVTLYDRYYPGDTIRIQERSRACIVLGNEAVLRLDQNTTVTFTGVEKKQTSLLDMLTGAIHFISRTPRALKVNTPFVDATVKGTEFLIEVTEDRTLITLFEGQVSATNQAGELLLTSGQSAIARDRQAPVPYVIVRPRDAVQWALYYPPIIDFRTEDFPGEEDWQAIVRKSIRYYWQGDLIRAFSSIERIQEDVRDTRFFNYRAALLLSVGRVNEALLYIEKTLNLAPEDSHAIALQSIIAIVRNEKEKGLELALKAAEADPGSAVPRVALSYAHQAGFNLDEAMANVRKAVELDPGNGLAWARLAELLLSLRYTDKAIEAANKAVALNPDLAATHIVSGFAYLIQIKMQESFQSFEKAIELDQANPLARLGLGLAKIRRGKIKEGRREIEIAVGLDPNQSIIRSYLGKSYYEEKRSKLAGDQFTIAKELDPLDPTPFFYDAIRKQTENRPVEALQDLQKSIELNDNRALYRSRLLLDSDLAARSASLARVYTDLGYQQLALVEGWKSVNIDPGNYSAHRFLADTYSALPRHEIARVSELLQSQLLQPVNITPVQPQLAESNLFILEGSGPTDLSFTEFNPLFHRNRFGLQASGVVGGNATLGSEIIHSGVYDRLSYSIGQFHYETDGFRENNDQEIDIYNLFTQFSLSHKTSIQAEFRYIDRERGDLPLRFNPDNFLRTFRQEEITRSARLGLHHAFTPHSSFITSFIYQKKDFSTRFTEIVDFDEEIKGFLGEIQHIFRTDRWSFISGAGHHNADVEEAKTIASSFIELDSNTRHTNLYVYSQMNYPDNVTLTLGGSADFYDDDDIDRDQFNPKIGLIWDVFPMTTVRAALFRTLKRSLISNQTIEPTQVAGFNQFFDDPTGTDAWRYGVAVDQKFSQTLYGGVEYSRRKLDVPFLVEDVSSDPPVITVDSADWRERLSRTYLYWAPHPWLATSAEFLYERFEREDELPGPELFTKIRTFRFPLGINFFHPSGFTARLKATFVDQEGKFVEFIDDEEVDVPGEDQFWLFDAAVGYRLPKRWGFISVEAKNLFDKKFKFQDTDPANPLIIPERLILARITLSF
jgi:tetratricopeptide (TPR) repeat protein